MKIVAISDIHGYLPEIPDCDLLLIAGDICPIENHALDYQKRWLDTEFRQWLYNVPASKVIGICGNHDLIFCYEPWNVPKDLAWTYLQDEGCEHEGLTIYGSPWQKKFGDFPFMAEEPQLQGIWSKIPDRLDVLLVHGPPKGYGDQAGPHICGSHSLLNVILQTKPRYVFCGHIHPANGEYMIEDTNLYNVAIMDNTYTPFYKPRIVEL